MNMVEKKWYWKLTFPFAHNNFTTIVNTVYCPKNVRPSTLVLRHEEIHSRQQKEIGILRFLFFYLFVLPLFWNPWRYKWELEAYTKGTGLSEKEAIEMIRGRTYGWLVI